MENGRKIYIVTEYFYKTKSYGLFGKAFNTKRKAIEFVLRHLSIEEMNKTERLYKRGLITKNEYVGNEHNFDIRELSLE